MINPDRRIPVESVQQLMGRCVEETGDEAFGLLAAEQLQPQVLHGLGLAWLASDTVNDGLKRTVRFGKLIRPSESSPNSQPKSAVTCGRRLQPSSTALRPEEMM